MSPLEFEVQMDRLNDCFKGFFSKTKTKVIANIVADLPQAFFEKCVDKVIWNDRPPKVEWFQELASAYKKRNPLAMEGYSSENLGPSVFDEDEIKMLFKTVRRKANGLVGDAEWTQFTKYVLGRVATSPQLAHYSCQTCFDKGTEFYTKNVDGRTYSYARDCACGVRT